MSIWGDIHRRANGIQKRKEDILLDTVLEEKIGHRLREFKVGPGQCTPLMIMSILVFDIQTRYISLKTVTCASVVHSDGSRDFCSRENISKIIECVGNGELVSIN